MNDFTFAMNETERQDVARVLEMLINVFANGKPSAAPRPRSTPAAGEIPQTFPRDRWTHDREGKEIPQPDAEAYTVRIWKCEQGQGKNGPFLDVRWEQKRAYCHDQKLFPWIIQAVKTRSQIILYLKLQNNFDTIVGVKT